MYQFFNSDLFGVPMETANWIASGIVALVAVFILYLLYKMFTRPRMASGRRSKNARLAITDAASIDDRRRLVLVRRDNVEHLIMIGGETDMVIESDIDRQSAATAETKETVAPAAAAATPARTPPPPPPPIPRAEPVAANSSAKPDRPAVPAAKVETPKPAKPVEATKPAEPAPAVSPSVTAKPISATASAPSSTPVANDASSLIGSVGSKPSSTTPSSPSGASPAPSVTATADKPKTSVGDNMDALLTEITAKK